MFGTPHHGDDLYSNLRTGALTREAFDMAMAIARYDPREDCTAHVDAYKRHNAVLEMAKATSHLVSWTYTHWDWRRYRKTLLRANALGMTINVSTEDPAEAVKAFRAGLPVTLVAPPTQRRPLDLDGIPGYICPALLQEGFTCDDCGNGSPLCARADRHFIVVFPAHGSRANKVWSLIKPLWEHWWSSRGEQPPC